MSDKIALHSDGLRATVSTLGAELVDLRLLDDTPLLWQGDPAYWAKCSPILFPIVGSLKDRTMRVGGKSYQMGIHGFAAAREFTVAGQSDTHCRLVLKDDEQSRAQYPYPFELALDYRLRPAALEMEGTVRNPGEAPLPCSFGFHPGFLWPLTAGRAREDYRIQFEQDEPGPVHRPNADSLLGPESPTPVQGRTLPLSDAVFEKLAIVFRQHSSRAVTYGAPGEIGLKVEFPGFPHLGIWTKPGNPFVCVEPWQGHASPPDFDGEFPDKPGLVQVPPGEARHWRMRISLERIVD